MNISVQLQKARDDSVKRYAFKQVIPAKTRYLQLRGPLDWIERSRLLSKNYIIDREPASPLSTQVRENIFNQ